MCYDSVEWDYGQHLARFLRDEPGAKWTNPSFCESYRNAFLDLYPHEEYQFRYHHGIPFIPQWKAPILPLESEGPVFPRQDQLQSDQDKEARFCQARHAMVLMREFIRQTIWLSGFDPRGSAIAVPNEESADYLRNALRFGGTIINLESLDYPGMDKMHPAQLTGFTECGFDSHCPVQRADTKWLTNPIWIRRGDETFGFLKCTFKHVQFVRWWTEFWYPATILKKQMAAREDQLFNFKVYAEMWRVFLKKKTDDLVKTFPGIERDFWSEYDPNFDFEAKYPPPPQDGENQA